MTSLAAGEQGVDHDFAHKISLISRRWVGDFSPTTIELVSIWGAVSTHW